MEMKKLAEHFVQHPFVRDIEDKYIDVLLNCASEEKFKKGEFLFKEGEDASKFYLIRSGKVNLGISDAEKGEIDILTLRAGEVLGWSWIVTPYVWHFDAEVTEDVTLFSLDGECLKAQCEKDKVFGYEILKRVSQLIEQRLNILKMQLMDRYTEG